MSLRVLRPGLLTTVQDLGRRGWQRHGVVVGGAVDVLGLRVANLLVGNPEGAAGLEATLIGPSIEFVDDHLVALGGGDLGASLDGEPVPPGRPVAALAGSTLDFAGGRTGCRAYLTVAGGLDVPVVLGGRGTDLRAGFGGHHGRALVEGDELAAGKPSPAAARWLDRLLERGRPVADWGAGRDLLDYGSPEPVLRVLPGPEHDGFTAASRRALAESAFTVTARSDRMGCALDGPALELERPQDLVSSPVTRGTLQVPPSGGPIVLMADAQSVGGYPRLAHVITADLPLLAQAPPGTSVRFLEVTVANAHAALLEREQEVRELALALRLRQA